MGKLLMNYFSINRNDGNDLLNNLDDEAKKVFDHYEGDELVLLGYENNHSWADSRENK